MIKDFSATSFVIGVMVGALLAGAWFLGGDINLDPGFSPLSTTSTDLAPQESGAISVANQPSGDSVIVESVTVPPPGIWIAVLEVNGRDLGNVLGAARVVGPHTDVEVSLLRPTEPGRSYAVQLYRDDNNGMFDPSINSVYVDFDTGSRVVAYFMTTE
ncbi:hypothetical protein A2118_01140 [Candidatus Kaiserbacteria bacterium GWA2_50_9]|uniref:DUF7282 domain-containing protein n=1 Tax=Candidatus Kaiserbacteria bacterium GWA2_50_9 TaxID=1798474 RepID=A0A1F6BSN7_9BACT|nr:MAG: hypothetical protein A2118_01140 [Candidatus Kaiserbacteria bacterium GWA2_50_9]